MIRFGAVVIDDEIVYDNNRCQLKINNGEYTRGQILMTNSEICFKREGSENGFMIPWDKITVQAITQEPQRCVYFMIDVAWPAEDQVPQNAANGNGIHVDANEEAEHVSEDEGNDSEGSLQELTEFYIIPDSPECVDEIYFVMSKFPAAAPMDESDDDDFFDGDNIDQMNINDDKDEDEGGFADGD